MITKIRPEFLARLLTWAGDTPVGQRQLEEPDAHPGAFNPECYDLDAAAAAANELIEEVYGEEVHGSDLAWAEHFAESMMIWELLAIHFRYQFQYPFEYEEN